MGNMFFKSKEDHDLYTKVKYLHDNLRNPNQCSLIIWKIEKELEMFDAKESYENSCLLSLRKSNEIQNEETRKAMLLHTFEIYYSRYESTRGTFNPKTSTNTNSSASEKYKAL